MNIKDANGDHDGECDEDHGEEEIFAEERHRQRGRRNDLGEQQEEHSERQEDGDAEGHLLTRVGGQVEYQNGEETNAHAGNDQVHRVKQRLPPHC